MYNNFKYRIRNLLMGLEDIFFPPCCFNCLKPLFGKGRKYICKDCIKSIGMESPVATEAQRKSPRGFSQSFSLGIHEGILKSAVHNFKYRGRIRLGREIVDEYLQRRGEEILAFDFDYVTFVPLHPFREWRRGYNQASIIAGMISIYAGKKTVPFLRRLKYTKQQVGLGRNERKENVKGAFALRKNLRKDIRNKRIILVDDVITTGATATECAGLLKSAGAAEVGLFTISRRHL